MGLREEVMNYGHHQASCLSSLKIMEIICQKFMREEDRFILSKAHASGVLYYLLAEKGLFEKSEIAYWPSHCTYGMPGVEFTGGSLGMGLGVACGVALSLKNKKTNSFVICLVGDGELYEGSNWEALMFASAHKLNNLICIVDRNYMSASDWTENYLPLEPLADKFKAFGWEVKNESISRQLDSDKPRCYIINTIKGDGCPEFEGNPLCHTMKI